MFFSIQLSVSFLYSVFNEHSPLSSSPFLPLGIPEFSDNFVCQLLFDLAKSKVFWPPVLPAGGLKWTRTTDLPLIRRVL